MGPVKRLWPQWENFPLFTLVFWVFCWQRLGILLCADTLPSFPFLSASWPISYLTPADITISNTFFIKTFFRNRIWSVLLASGDIHAKTGVWEKCPAVTGTKWSSHCPNSETSGIHSRLGLLVNCFSSRETAGWGKRRWCLLASLFAMLHTGCAPNTGASHSVGKTRGTMVSKFEGFWHDSARGCPVYRKNPQHHSYRPLKQHATLDPKQHSSNTTWGWRGHCWDRASKPPLSTSWAACAALLAQQSSTSTVWKLQHWKMALQQLTLLSQGASLAPWLTIFLPNKCKTMKSTFPSWQRWGLHTFHIIRVFCFRDSLCNKTDDAFSSRSCLPENTRETVLPTLEWPLKYHFHRKI